MTQRHIKTASDIAAHIITAAAIIYTAATYPSLPDTVPVHYGITGEMDATGDKSTIWTPLIVLVVMHIGFGLLNRFPQIFNYPVTIRDRHRTEVYSTAQHMVSWLRLLTDTLFASLLFCTMRGSDNVLWMLLLAAIGYPVILVYFNIRIKRINDR